MKEIMIYKNQIKDLERQIKHWQNEQGDYMDLLVSSKKDLKSKKIKFMNVFYKYYSSADWSWVFHKKGKQLDTIKKQFNPIYKESRRMSKLVGSDLGGDERLSFRNSDLRLNSARSYESFYDNKSIVSEKDDKFINNWINPQAYQQSSNNRSISSYQRKPDTTFSIFEERKDKDQVVKKSRNTLSSSFILDSRQNTVISKKPSMPLLKFPTHVSEMVEPSVFQSDSFANAHKMNFSNSPIKGKNI